MECDSSAIPGQFDKYIFVTQQSPAFRYRYLLRLGECVTSANLSRGSEVSNRNADLTEDERGNYKNCKIQRSLTLHFTSS